MAQVIARPKFRLLSGALGIEVEAPAEIRDGAYDVGSIGAYTYLGGGDSIVRHVDKIGRFCSIAPNVSFGLVEHPTSYFSMHHIFEGGGSKQLRSNDLQSYHSRNAETVERLKDNWLNSGKNEKITIGDDVWIGEAVLISRGVSIGDGAVIAARSVVTKSVPPYAVVGGVPAKLIKFRFDEPTIERFKKVRWTDYGLSVLDGAPIDDVAKTLDMVESNIREGAKPMAPPKFIVSVPGERHTEV